MVPLVRVCFVVLIPLRRQNMHVDHVCVDRIRSGQMSIIKRLFPAKAMLIEFVLITEPPRGKTNNLHMRKQRRRSASQ